MMGDESSDSGSQVIALDDSGAFESDADVAVGDSAEPVLVAEDSEGLDVQLEPIDEARPQPSHFPYWRAIRPPNHPTRPGI